MATFNWCYAAVEKIAEGDIDLGVDTFYIGLTNTAPTTASTFRSGISEVANGNGYTTGGKVLTTTSSAQTSGLYKWIVSSPSAWTGGPSAMGTFQYVFLYKSTGSAATDPVLGWWDYGSAVTLASGETFTATADGTNGIVQLAI